MKKRNYRRVLSCVLAVLMLVGMVPAMGVSAATSEISGVAAQVKTAKTGETYTYGDFEYSVKDGEVTIAGYTGNEAEVEIPAEIEGYPVTSIGSLVFENCASLRKAVIPDSVVSIGYGTFINCSRLYDLVLPQSIERIDSYAFYGCESLVEVEIPKKIKRIEHSIFEKCEGLRTVVIPDGVTTIADRVFFDCAELEFITIPQSVRWIGDTAFAYCSGIKSITISENVDNIGDGAFLGCYGVGSIHVDEDNEVYDSRDNCNAIIETATNTLLHGCWTTKIPDGIKSIGSRAFYMIRGIDSVTIPYGVESIGEYAFYDIYWRLESVTIPNSVKSIGRNAFDNCSYLTDVYFIGTQKEWEAIAIGANNGILLNATIHFLPEVEFNGSSVTLYGDLGVNFYMEVPDEILTDEDSTVIFTYGGNVEMVPASSGERTDYGYKYTCNIPAKDMLTEVTCTMELPDGTQSAIFSYTVKEYAETILSNPEAYGEKTVELVKSMLNYGAAAQEYFGYNTDILANESEYMTKEDKTVPEKDFSNLSFDLAQGEDVQYYGTALSLKSEVGIKHYFILAEGVNPDDVFVTVDGAQAKLVKNGNLYMVEIPDVAAHKLYTKFEVKVGDTTISYCVMDYAKTAQDAGKQELLNVMYALDVFAQNAVAYKG